MGIQVRPIQALWGLTRRATQRAFVRQVGVLTAANMLGALFSVIQGAVVARWLGPELYGVAALVISYPDLLYTLFDARSVEASVKYINLFHSSGERRKVLAVCKLGYIVDFAISVAAIAVVLATANWAADRLTHRPDLVWLMFVYALAFVPRTLVGTSQAVMVSVGKFSLIARLNLCTSFVRTALVLAMVLVGWNVAAVVLGAAIATAFMGLTYGASALWLMRRHWNGSVFGASLHEIRESRSEILKFLLYNDLHALLGVIPKQLDLVLLGYLGGPTQAGYYKIGKSVSSSLGFLSAPLQSVAYPRLARLYSLGKRVELDDEVRKLALKVGIPAAVTALVGMASVPFILPSLIGLSFQPAVRTTQLLMFGQIGWLAVFWLRPLYFSKDLIRTWTLGFAAYCAGFILLAVPLTLQYAADGLALAGAVSASLFYLVMLKLILSRRLRRQSTPLGG